MMDLWGTVFLSYGYNHQADGGHLGTCTVCPPHCMIVLGVETCLQLLGKDENQ